MATTPHHRHHRHQLLLVVVVVVIIVPSCWSLCDISDARRDVQQTGAGGGSGEYEKINPNSRTARNVARRAAKGADVKLHRVEEAYHVVSVFIFISVTKDAAVNDRKKKKYNQLNERHKYIHCK